MRACPHCRSTKIVSGEAGDREASECSDTGVAVAAVTDSLGRVPRTTSMFGEDDMQAAFQAGIDAALEAMPDGSITVDDFWAWFDEYRGPVAP